MEMPKAGNDSRKGIVLLAPTSTLADSLEQSIRYCVTQIAAIDNLWAQRSIPAR